MPSSLGPGRLFALVSSRPIRPVDAIRGHWSSPTQDCFGGGLSPSSIVESDRRSKNPSPKAIRKPLQMGRLGALDPRPATVSACFSDFWSPKPVWPETKLRVCYDFSIHSLGRLAGRSSFSAKSEDIPGGDRHGRAVLAPVWSTQCWRASVLGMHLTRRVSRWLAQPGSEVISPLPSHKPQA